MGSMILKRSSISRSREKPTPEVIVAPWKSIMMARLKFGRITSFWISPLASKQLPNLGRIARKIPHFLRRRDIREKRLQGSKIQKSKK
jgi:hypothetical protein